MLESEMTPYYQDESVQLFLGDCRDVLPALADCSVDSVVTDPPYALNFMSREWDSYNTNLPQPDFMNWFAGFVDGEGCFSVHKKGHAGTLESYDCQFSVSLRRDDKPILEEIRRTLGIGTVADGKAGATGSPKARYCVSSKSDCLRLVEILRAAPLRAKKALDFEMWVEALDAWIRHRPGEWASMKDPRDRLMASREYVEYGKIAGAAGPRAYQTQMKIIFRECLRVLKPGGHLLAFGGSRTYHRLACAIEDAGFEIRDQIQWIYAQGFPKSLDVSANLRENGSVCICNENGKTLPQHSLRSLSDSDIPPPLYAQDQSREVLQSSVSQQGASKHGAAWSKSETSRFEQSCMEGRGDLLSETRELCTDQVRALPAGVFTDGPQGRVRDGAPPDHGPMDWTPANPNGGCSSRRSRSSEQPANEPASMAGQPQSQTSGAWPLCGRCGKPMVPDGLGSALKPAHEPIVLARKPLDSTLIQNVLKHGTGGINVDGCRIEASEKTPAPVGRYVGSSIGPIGHNGLRDGNADQLGRWPANVIHDGSDEVLAGFPETSSGIYSGKRNEPKTKNAFGAFVLRDEDPATYGDSGSAARFFYCPKASKEDREEGLDDLLIRSAGEVTDRQDGTDGLNSPRAGAGRTNGSRNHHPTVKPINLAKYLCRLITPPSGLVLDPFAGSGSLGIGALLEGFSFIGIEKESDYCEIAKRRLQYWAAHYQPRLFRPDGMPSPQVCDTTDTGQLDLLTGLQSPDRAIV